METFWWQGKRGEWLVVAQFALIVLVLAGPRTAPGLPAFPPSSAIGWVGLGLIAVGSGLALAASLRLGPSLTPLPYPAERSQLVRSGPYALVRHPIYSGLLLFALGWALHARGWLTLGYVLPLFVLLDLKSRREEVWLVERFETYTAYQQSVRKLIPFLY